MPHHTNAQVVPAASDALNDTVCSLNAPYVRAAQQLGLDAFLIAALYTSWQLVEMVDAQCRRL